MATTAMQELIGDLRYTLSVQLKKHYPDMDGPKGFLQSTEAYFIRVMYNVDPKGLSANYYIAPGDGAGPIVVEVGDMSDGKWDGVLSTDKQPVRVLRIGMDRALNLLHPRNTQFEGDMLSVLKMNFQPSAS